MFRVLLLVLLSTFAAPFNPVYAAETASRQTTVSVFDLQKPGSGARSFHTKAAGDTLFLYGDAATLEGQFETAGGLPDAQGWISVDRTEEPLFWHPSEVWPGVVSPSITYLLAPTNIPVSDAGQAVASGDVDGDGVDDIVALYSGTDTSGFSYHTYAVYLGEEPIDNLPDFEIEVLHEAPGEAMCLCDTDGDGDDDIFVTEFTVGPSSTSWGEVGMYRAGPSVDGTRDYTVVSGVTVGQTLVCAGDLNGDGRDDLMVQTDGVNQPPTQVDPSVQVYLGEAAGTLSADVTVNHFASGFGRDSIGGGGDLNGDGFDDFYIGLNNWNVVDIYHGSLVLDNVSDLTLTTANVNDFFGSRVATAGDVDGDGFDDLLVQAWGVHAPPALRVGAVYLFRGGDPMDTVSDREFIGTIPDGDFGDAVLPFGDANEDGFDDFVIGDPLADASEPGAGVAFLYLGGPDVNTLGLLTFEGDVDEGNFGRSLASGNVDGMTSNELVSGASGDFVYSVHLVDAPGSPQNSVAYCGVESDPTYSNTPGYGNDWYQELGWYFPVVDELVSSSVRLKLRLDHSVEQFYDFVRVGYSTPTGFVSLQDYTGLGRADMFDQTFALNPADYDLHPVTGVASIHLSILVESDGGFSDEDGFWPSQLGAAQVDNIEVWVDGTRESHATFEPGGPSNTGAFSGFDADGWDAVPRLFGDFAKLVSNFQDIAPGPDNPTPMWSFIDDGTPPVNDPFGRSTGGSTGTTTYGVPGNWVVNYTGGLDPFLPGISNEVWSPEILWDDPQTTTDDDYDVAAIAFDVYSHLPQDNGLAYRWRIRSIPSGESEWGPWKNNFFHYFTEDPTYIEQLRSITDLVEPDDVKIQIALGVRDLTSVLGLPGGDSTPSPLFDNARVFKLFNTGQVTTVHPVTTGLDETVFFGNNSITFSEVVLNGQVTIVENPALASYPTNIQLATDPPSTWDIDVDSNVYTGSVTLCFGYDDAALQIPEQDLQLLHFDGTTWVDITTSHDMVTNQICGVTDTLSPFTIGYLDPATATPETLPNRAILHAATPNPFNPLTTLSFTLPTASSVSLVIYDVAGRVVRTLMQDETLPSGTHSRTWNGTDERGQRVASGAYFYRLAAGGFSDVGKVMLVE